MLANTARFGHAEVKFKIPNSLCQQYKNAASPRKNLMERAVFFV
ncbi:MAG: hypothetical protein U5L45_20800 [Saprospiraceae bacterium]|nr:hypothetical protein [Saprospiraceae bacterium]